MAFLNFKLNSFGQRYASGKPLDSNVRQPNCVKSFRSWCKQIHWAYLIPRAAQQATAMEYKVDYKVVSAVWKRCIVEGSESRTESRSCSRSCGK